MLSSSALYAAEKRRQKMRMRYNQSKKNSACALIGNDVHDVLASFQQWAQCRPYGFPVDGLRFVKPFVYDIGFNEIGR